MSSLVISLGLVLYFETLEKVSTDKILRFMNSCIFDCYSINPSLPFYTTFTFIGKELISLDYSQRH